MRADTFVRSKPTKYKYEHKNWKTPKIANRCALREFGPFESNICQQSIHAKTNVVEPHHVSPCESLRESHVNDDRIACCQLGWLVFETDGFRIRNVFI